MSNLSKITCVEDFHRLARRRVPRMFYDYVDTGSWTESTYEINESDLGRLKFRQRVARNIENRTLTSRMLDTSVAMPVAIAPVGSAGMLHADGEILGARAAEKFGVPFILSTMSVCSIEDVVAQTAKPFWFQLYVIRDRHFIESLIERAKRAGCSALVLTLDLQIVGQRHKDIKNGLTTPPKPTLSNLLNLMTKPMWCARMMNTRHRSFGNIVGHVKGVGDVSQMTVWANRQFDPTLSWDDVEWIKRRWGGKLVVKGITDVEDARAAVDCGADALIVSNHGGRQLDGAPSSISMLPAIAQAVGSRIEVWFDGGIRSGQDVLRALALGAQGVLVGRAFAYALAAAGEGGVSRCLEIIRNEMDLTMAFCGYTDVTKVDRNILCNGNLFSDNSF